MLCYTVFCGLSSILLNLISFHRMWTFGTLTWVWVQNYCRWLWLLSNFIRFQFRNWNCTDVPQQVGYDSTLNDLEFTSRSLYYFSLVWLDWVLHKIYFLQLGISYKSSLTALRFSQIRFFPVERWDCSLCLLTVSCSAAFAEACSKWFVTWNGAELSKCWALSPRMAALLGISDDFNYRHSVSWFGSEHLDWLVYHLHLSLWFIDG